MKFGSRGARSSVPPSRDGSPETQLHPTIQNAPHRAVSPAIPPPNRGQKGPAMKPTQKGKNTWRQKNVPTTPPAPPKKILCAFAPRVFALNLKRSPTKHASNSPRPPQTWLMRFQHWLRATYPKWRCGFMRFLCGFMRTLYGSKRSQSEFIRFQYGSRRIQSESSHLSPKNSTSPNKTKRSTSRRSACQKTPRPNAPERTNMVRANRNQRDAVLARSANSSSLPIGEINFPPKTGVRHCHSNKINR